MATDNRTRSRKGGAESRVRTKFAAVIEAAGTAEEAWLEQQEALAAADAAEDRFRAAVGALVAKKQSLEDIAELADVPLEAVRAARRAKSPAEYVADARRKMTEAGEDPDREVHAASTPTTRGEREARSAMASHLMRREAEASVALSQDPTAQTIAVGEPVGDDAQHALVETASA